MRTHLFERQRPQIGTGRMIEGICLFIRENENCTQPRLMIEHGTLCSRHVVDSLYF